MCGIVGYVGHKNSINFLLDGLESLEYLGYDSAGIAYMTCNRTEVVKTGGKIKSLKNKVKNNVTTNIGIGHTRWATNGRPNEVNAHPHRVGKFTIVHNGIIENYEALKKILVSDGYKFKSDTDSEVIAALLDKFYHEKNDILKVLIQVKKLLIGSYALAILCDDIKDKIYAIKKDSPLIIGLGNKENFITSNIPAILKYTKSYYVLNDDDIAEVSYDVKVFNENLKLVSKEKHVFEGNVYSAEKLGFEHFMLKEIYDEPETIKNTVSDFLKQGITSLTGNMIDFSKYNKIEITSCGSAYHAGAIGKYLIEKYGNIPVNVYVASEYRYAKNFLDENSLVILISQSGETADTLACLRKIKQERIDNLAIINTFASSLAREADNVIYTKAGNEVAIATTKAFLASVAILSLIALNIGYSKNNISKDDVIKVAKAFEDIPNTIKELIEMNYKDVAKVLAKNKVCFYIGRGIDYALSMEGSLKLKELAYINSICFPAGELKHGTISLIENKTPVISIISDKKIASKTISNLKEVKARGAYVILIITDNIKEDISAFDKVIKVKYINDFICPILISVCMQLIGYETAKLLKRDIDKPKNLAKTVTVE